MDGNSIIRFDWAAKRLLRDKANYAVLEGLVTVLLGEKITIIELLESESNQDTLSKKFNRIDLKTFDSNGDIILIELQMIHEWYSLLRAYGVLKPSTVQPSFYLIYKEVKKIIVINILYFDLGKGSDYLYHGTTTFVGVHTGDELQIRKRDDIIIKPQKPSELFPEYYLIRVNEFNDVAKTPIDEWLDFLKNNHIKDDTQTPGLREAKEQLRIMQMNEAERKAYDDYLDTIRTQDSVLDTYRTEGLIEGRAEGLAQGLAQCRAEGHAEGEYKKAISVAKELKKMNVGIDVICQVTGLSETEIKNIE